MRIGIDARFLANQRRGIGRYSFNLISRLLRMDEKNHYILYFDRNFDKSFMFNYGNYEYRCMGNGNFTLWEQYYLPKQLRHDQLDLFHSPGNIPPFLSKTKRVITLHDTMMFQPEMSTGSWWYNVYLRTALSLSMEKMNRIITISNHSKKDILRLFPQIAQKVDVIYEAVEEKFGPSKDENKIELVLRKYKITRPFILHFGSNDPRKNTLMAIRVYHRLLKEQGIPHKLLLLGFRLVNKTQIDCYLKENNLTERVISVDFLPDDDLPCFYQDADFLLYPSLYEGFGLPPLEAMACATPVVASNTSSIPEIVDGAAILVDPTNESEIYKSCIELLYNGDKRKELIAQGLERVKQFSWENTSYLTLRVYEEVAKE